MTETDASSKSLPARPPKTEPARKPSSGQFKKGKSGNPTGRPKGSLSKTTQLKNLMTQGMWSRAQKVLQNVLQKAESGSDKHEEMVLRTVIQPFLKREADGEGGGDRKPTIVINVGKTNDVKPIEGQAVRVKDV